MKTYQDLMKVTSDTEKMAFAKTAAEEYKASDLYKSAKTGYDYFIGQDTTIMNYRKLLYTLSGTAVPDNYSANYKFPNAFFKIFTMQEVSHLLGNGVTFQNEATKEAFGGDNFDKALYKIATASLWGGVAYGFFNLDEVVPFKSTEFCPLFDEENGSLRAGIRFWQINTNKPLRLTLFEEDGYTEYIFEHGEGKILEPKRAYIQIARSSEATGVAIYDGENYPAFPIVPLWANIEHTSPILGLREKIDGYDLVQSGFANDLEDAAQIYWTLQNEGGMDDVDLAKFIERMKTVKAAVVDEAGGRATAHTIEVPTAAREALLNELRESLYRDAMALDTEKISAGGITATAITAAYENLSLKTDAFEMCVTDFIRGLCELKRIDDSPNYKRSKIVNQQEETTNILAAAQYLDIRTVLEHLPFISPDEIDTILDRRTQEEANRYENAESEYEEEPETESEE